MLLQLKIGIFYCDVSLPEASFPDMLANFSNELSQGCLGYVLREISPPTGGFLWMLDLFLLDFT